MADETYNGWTNKPTWLVKLWIDNDQGEQEYWTETARELSSDIWHLSDQIKEAYTENFYEKYQIHGDQADIYLDLMTYALAIVNWDEVAKALAEDAKELA